MNRWAWRERWFYAVAAAALWSSMGLAQQPVGTPIDGVYQGTLGKQEIVLEVGAVVRKSGEPPTIPHFVGRYFYRRYGVAIGMQGEPLKDGSVRLREYQGEKETGAQWRMTFHDDKANGAFCKCDIGSLGAEKEGLKITLARVSQGFDPDLEWRNGQKQPDMAYYDLLVDFPLQAGHEIRVAQDMAYEVQNDPRFKAGMPHLTQFPNAAVMERVNENLAREFKTDRIWVADCLVGEALGGSYEEKIEVTAFTREVLSVVKDSLSFCGGAYPNGETTTLTYNMRTGESFRLYGLLDDEVRPDKSSKYASYGHPLPWVLTDLYLRHYRLPDGLTKEDCDEVLGVDEDGKSRLIPTFARWPDTVVFLRKGGLVISPVFPHAYQGCGPEVTVPYREILPLLTKNGVLRSMVQSIEEFGK